MHFPTTPGMTPTCASCENGQRSPGARCRISVPAVDEPLYPRALWIIQDPSHQQQTGREGNTKKYCGCKYIWKSIMWFKIWTRVAFETPIFHVSIQPNLSLHMCYQYPFSPLLYTSIYLVLLLTKLDLYVALEESRTVHWSCSSS